jgi:hypothetical protein
LSVIRKDKNMSVQDITNKIERLEAMEEKCGISLDAMYASLAETSYTGKYIVTLNGEIHSANGTKIAENLRIAVTLHDDTGRVVNRKEHWVSADRFFGMESFSVGFTTEDVPYKIRIQPTKF